MGFLLYLLNSIFILGFSFKSYSALIKPTTPIKSKTLAAQGFKL